MSVLEDLRGLEARVVSRIRELEGAVTELNELHAVAERLGIDISATKPRSTQATRKSATGSRRVSATSTARKPRRSAAKRAGSTRSAGRRDDVVRAIKDQPGVTVREIGQQLGVDPTGLYRVVNKLQSDGIVKRKAGKLELTRSKT
jgi:hypothetical protein